MKLHPILAAITIAASALPAAASSVSWSYAGAEGPEYWGELAPDFATCSTGQQQSPIDLNSAVAADAKDITLNWNPAASWTVVNNGHTIQGNADDAGTMLVGDTAYKLLQFHFHAPSEHAIDGARTQMEAHFVHQADDGSLAVLGVMMQGGGENALFDAVMSVAPTMKAEAAMGAGDPNMLLPGSHEFFRYQGSLTTPPCAETVLWTVLKEPVKVSDEQIAAFEALYDMNARPLQPLNRRYILSE